MTETDATANLLAALEHLKEVEKFANAAPSSREYGRYAQAAYSVRQAEIILRQIEKGTLYPSPPR
jgi:hypothetical protein